MADRSPADQCRADIEAIFAPIRDLWPHGCVDNEEARAVAKLLPVYCSAFEFENLDVDAYEHATEWRERAEKAEAELAKMRANLGDYVHEEDAESALRDERARRERAEAKLRDVETNCNAYVSDLQFRLGAAEAAVARLRDVLQQWQRFAVRNLLTESVKSPKLYAETRDALAATERRP